MKYTASYEGLFGEYPDIKMEGEFSGEDEINFSMVIDGKKYRLIASGYVLEYSGYESSPQTHQFETLEGLNGFLPKMGDYEGKNCTVWHDGAEENGGAMWRTAKVDYFKALKGRMENNRTASEQKMRAELAQYDYEIKNLSDQIDRLTI